MIRIDRNSQELLRKIQSDQVVSVKILSKNDNKTMIDVNGVKITASSNENLPDNFLAFVEKSDNHINLRILDSFMYNKDYQTKISEELRNKIQQFLLQENMNTDQDTFNTALNLVLNNLKLDKQTIKWILQMKGRFGDNALNFIYFLLKKGLILEPDEIAFFNSIRETIRNLYIYNKQSELSNYKEDIELTENFVKYLFGQEMQIYFNEFNQEELMIMKKIKEDENSYCKRYFFDLSNQDFNMTIEILDKTDSYEVILKLSELIYEKLSNMKDILKDKIAKSIHKPLVMNVGKLVDHHEVWLINDYSQSQYRMMNLNLFA